MDLSEVGRIVTTALTRKNSVQIYRHIDSLSVKCNFSDDRLYRYKLTATKQDASKHTKIVCVIMQNPSYANNDIADKSVNFLEQLIFESNFDYFNEVKKMIVVNQYAEIKTEDFIPNDNSIGKDNDNNIKQAINESDIIIVAWGASNKYSERKEFVHQLLRSTSNKKILKTKKHPSLGSLKEEFLETYTSFNKS